jgi:hypothetical protein
MPKNTKTVHAAVGEEAVKEIDTLCSRIPLKPSRSKLCRALVLFMLDSIRSGRVSLKAVISDISAKV